MMVVEILETTSADLDVYVGVGNLPYSALQKAASAEEGPMEYLNIIQPNFGGTCWIMVQNWQASTAGGTDSVKLAYGFVSKATSTNYTVTGPTSVPALNPFDVTVSWDLGSTFDSKEVWYGWFSIGTSATKKDDVGKINFNLYKAAGEEPELKSIYLPMINRP